ncbi:MAG: chemotaxis protein CheD [Planctomycetaceae bacterium]|nr:chemotaxis protein CheD [Planctomycetaceae bacterium]
MKLARGQADQVVTHALGSCLGVSAYDPLSKVGGLLHVMMPVSSANPDKARSNPYMFVDTGIPAFFAAMVAAGAERRRLRVKIAGGAAINSNDHFAIGRKNCIAMKSVLWKAGVLIEAQDVGGSAARTMCLDLSDGRVIVSNAGKQWLL